MAERKKNNWDLEYKCHVTDTEIKRHFSGSKQLLLLLAALLALLITSTAAVFICHGHVGVEVKLTK